MVQDGDDGVNVVFDVADFDTVAEILKLRRRRRKLSPEQAAALAERGRKYRFSPGAQIAGAAQRRTDSTTPDSEAA